MWLQNVAENSNFEYTKRLLYSTVGKYLSRVYWSNYIYRNKVIGNITDCNNYISIHSYVERKVWIRCIKDDQNKVN